MRIYFDDIRRPKRVARALHRELNRVGTDIGLTAAQDLTARVYGYDSFHELKGCIATRAASEWDEKCPAAVIDARLEHQCGVLVRHGVNPATAASVIAALKPTGRHGRLSRGTDAPSPTPPKGEVTEIDALLDSLEDKVSLSPDRRAEIDDLILRAYDEEFRSVEVKLDEMCWRMDFVAAHGKAFASLYTTRELKAVARYLEEKAGIDPYSWNEKDGRFTIKRGTDEIRVRVRSMTDRPDGYLAVSFDNPKVPNLLTGFEVENLGEWLESFKGKPGLHVVATRLEAEPLTRALASHLMDAGHTLDWSDSGRGPSVPPEGRSAKRGVCMHGRGRNAHLHKTVAQEIASGLHSIMVVDALRIESAIVELVEEGHTREFIRSNLRSAVFPTHERVDACGASRTWKAHVFRAAD